MGNNETDNDNGKIYEKIYKKPKHKKCKLDFDHGFRRLCKSYKEKVLDYWVNKLWYREVHDSFVFFISVIMLFNNNLSHLIAILAIVTFDAFSVIALHECPLTTLEMKYIRNSGWHERNRILKKLNLSFKCSHVYESQLELLINVWMLISGKMIVIMLLRMFNINICNPYSLYK